MTIRDNTELIQKKERRITLLDEYLPEYNILPLVLWDVNDEVKAKISLAMSAKSPSQDVPKAMIEHQKRTSNTFYGKSHADEVKNLLCAYALAQEANLTVLSTVNHITVTYKSPRNAAEALECKRSSVQKYNGRLFKHRYFITVSSVG